MYTSYYPNACTRVIYFGDNPQTGTTLVQAQTLTFNFFVLCKMGLQHFVNQTENLNIEPLNLGIVKDMKMISVDLNNHVHCEALIRLMNDYMQDEMGIGEAMPDELGPRVIDGLRNHTSYIGFFVEVNNEFAALANCNLNYSTWKAQPLINIHDFIVAPKNRNRGVGLFLLQSIENYAVQNGYCRINLEVRNDNHKAQSLYKKAGFKECDPSNYFWEKSIE